MASGFCLPLCCSSTVSTPTRHAGPFLPSRLTKVVAEGKGTKGVDAALRAAGLGMADKAASVREAGSALLQEMLSQLGQEAVVGAAGLLAPADRKLAMEALSKALGGPVTAVPAAGAAAGAAGSSAAARPGTAAAAAKAPAARPGTRAGAARGAAAPALAAAPAAAAEPAAPAALLAFSEGKADRARRVRHGAMPGHCHAQAFCPCHAKASALACYPAFCPVPHSRIQINHPLPAAPPATGQV